MPEKGRNGSKDFITRKQLPSDQNCGQSFQKIEQQCQRCEPLTPGTQHICGADIARSNITDITRSTQFGEQQPERD